MENVQIFPEQLCIIQENIKQEIKLLGKTMEKIVGIDSLVALENYIESPAILRKLIVDEVKAMHSDMQKVFETFQENVDGCFDLTQDEENIVDVEITVSGSDHMENSKADTDLETATKAEPVLNESGLNKLHFNAELPDNFQKENQNTNDITIKHKSQIETNIPEENMETENKSSANGSFKFIARFPCIYCTKLFCTHLELRRHNKTFHNFDGVCCPICEKRMKFPQEVDEHIRSFHTGEKPFECSVCGKTFSRSTSFKVHQRVHSTVRPYICEMCGKSFRSRQDVQSHKLLHTGEKTFICGVCGKGFVRPQNLTQHMKVHNKSKIDKSKKKIISNFQT